MVCETYLRRTQAGLSGRVKEQQEGTSPNHVQAIFSSSVVFRPLNEQVKREEVAMEIGKSIFFHAGGEDNLIPILDIVIVCFCRHEV